MRELRWSVYFQNPEFLELTRMTMVLPEYEPLIRKWSGVKPGAKVLDVGCGTGFLARLMARDSGAAVAGLDRDDIYIEYAGRMAEEEDLDIDFVHGDALDMPFDDNSFDVVCSHTFLTSMPEPERAFAEMKRVAKPGGVIASITSMAAYPSAVSMGSYPEECAEWKAELEKVHTKLLLAYMKLDPLSRRITGISMPKIPEFFAKQGTDKVSAYPIGHMYSLSNAAMPVEDKLRWISLYHESEIKKLDAFMELPGMKELFGDEDAVRYKELLETECGFLRSSVHSDNSIWDLRGAATMLVTGIVNKETCI